MTAGSRITYPGAYRGADLQYDVGADQIKETIVIKDRSAATSYEFRLRARSGPRPTLRWLPGGSYGLSQPPTAGNILVLQAPHASDSPAAGPGPAGPDTEPHATMTVVKDGAADVVRVALDADWLNAPGRRFPVLLDPTIMVRPDLQDASFSASCTGCTPFVSDSLFTSVRATLACGAEPCSSI